jgi:hypothetical protein
MLQFVGNCGRIHEEKHDQSGQERDRRADNHDPLEADIILEAGDQQGDMGCSGIQMLTIVMPAGVANQMPRLARLHFRGGANPRNRGRTKIGNQPPDRASHWNCQMTIRHGDGEGQTAAPHAALENVVSSRARQGSREEYVYHSDRQLEQHC